MDGSNWLEKGGWLKIRKIKLSAVCQQPSGSLLVCLALGLQVGKKQNVNPVTTETWLEGVTLQLRAKAWTPNPHANLAWKKGVDERPGIKASHTAKQFACKEIKKIRGAWFEFNNYKWLIRGHLLSDWKLHSLHQGRFCCSAYLVIKSRSPVD